MDTNNQPCFGIFELAQMMKNDELRSMLFAWLLNITYDLDRKLRYQAISGQEKASSSAVSSSAASSSTASSSVAYSSAASQSSASSSVAS